MLISSYHQGICSYQWLHEFVNILRMHFATFVGHSSEFVVTSTHWILRYKCAVPIEHTLECLLAIRISLGLHMFAAKTARKL